MAGLLADGDVRVIPLWRDRCVVSGDQLVPGLAVERGQPGSGVRAGIPRDLLQAVPVCAAVST